MPIFMDQIRRLLGLSGPETPPAAGGVVGPVDAPATADEIIGLPDTPAQAPPMGILPQDMHGGPYVAGVAGQEDPAPVESAFSVDASAPATSITAPSDPYGAPVPVDGPAGSTGEGGVRALDPIGTEAGVTAAEYGAPVPVDGPAGSTGEGGVDPTDLPTEAKPESIGEDGLADSTSSSEATAQGALRTTETATSDYGGDGSGSTSELASPSNVASGVTGSSATPDPWGVDEGSARDAALGEGAVKPDSGKTASDGQQAEAGEPAPDDLSLDDEGPSTLLDDGALVTDAPALDAGDLGSLVEPDLGDVVEP